MGWGFPMGVQWEGIRFFRGQANCKEMDTAFCVLNHYTYENNEEFLYTLHYITLN